MDRYLKTVTEEKRGKAQEKFRIAQLCRSELGGKIVDEITSVDVATYRDLRLTEINPRTGKALSGSSVRLELSLLSNFFDLCRKEWGYCQTNPVDNVRKPKPAPSRDRRLSPREDRLILRYAYQYSNKTLYSIIVLALETAMRQGEILKLTWDHINLKTRIAHLPITKNGTKRDVPLSLRARDALVRLGPKPTGRVFDYSSDGLKSVWRAMIQKLGIENMHFHDLRHEATSRLFELGSLSMMEIAHITGHKSMAMLKKYTHLDSRNLVKKLEGGRSRGRQTVLDWLVPYPALIETGADETYRVTLLDFESLAFENATLDKAINDSRDGLLRRILTIMRDGKSVLPSPDQYLESVNYDSVVMIDPLAYQDEMLNTLI